eukprot:gene29537-36603_t
MRAYKHSSPTVTLEPIVMVGNNTKLQDGLVIYLQQEGRGVGLPTKVQLYKLIDEGYDTVTSMEAMGLQAEYREYGAVADILKELGVKSIKLITNNPYKVEKLTALGVVVTGRVASHMPPNEHNIGYLRAKRDLMAHKLDHVDSASEDGHTVGESRSESPVSAADVEAVGLKVTRNTRKKLRSAY